MYTVKLWTVVGHFLRLDAWMKVHRLKLWSYTSLLSAVRFHNTHTEINIYVYNINIYCT